jgi:hypothetical protein
MITLENVISLLLVLSVYRQMIQICIAKFQSSSYLSVTSRIFIQISEHFYIGHNSYECLGSIKDRDFLSKCNIKKKDSASFIYIMKIINARV